MSKVRTRFAPSPTGRMHVGNLRTALYAYLIAKHEGGDFILRIEDTDQERYVEGALDIIYHTLQETGLVHDEGPDKDGGVGPYVQSERQAKGIYLEYAKKLIEKGMTRSDLSKQSGVPLRTIESWCRRRRVPRDVYQLLKLAKVLGCQIEDLIELEAGDKKQEE